jgi:hypothetical protein
VSNSRARAGDPNFGNWGGFMGGSGGTGWNC